MILPGQAIIPSLKKKDSGWLRDDYFIHSKKLQMEGLYLDSGCKTENGTFYYFHANEKLSSKGLYKNGKKEGLWLSFHSNGMMKDSGFYVNDQLSGVYQSWYKNGFPKDSIEVKEKGRSVVISWFDDGTLSSAGYKLNDQLIGKWKYYHKNGQISAVETYDEGKLTSREYYGENGSLLADTTDRDRPAGFKGGKTAWVKFIESKMYFPTQYKFDTDGEAMILIEATIDEQGNVKDAETVIPLFKDFDEIAVKAMLKSPKWLPAIDHNRYILTEVRQPVTYTQKSY